MAIKILVPELGESVLEATVSRWLKKQGDFVNVGDVLVELETDKVNLEVGAKGSGVLAEVAAAEGADVKVGDMLGVIDEKAEQPKPSSPESKAPPLRGAQKREAEVKPAPQEAQAKPEPVREAEPQKARQATPVASRMARDKDVDINRVPGTGPEGRVTRADVEQFLQTKESPETAERQSPPPAPEPAPRSAGPNARARADGAARREERVRMSRRRRTIAQRLLEAQHNAAMLTTFNEVDMTAVMDLRKRRNEEFQARHGIKLGISSFFVKAAISALKAFPRLNAEIQEDEFLLKYYYDIGTAIGSEDGLVVPVIRDADRLTFAEIERQIKDLVAKSEQGKLSIEDLRGGTFTITNGGVFGSLLSTPILNPPQVGILGLHKIEDRPVAVNGEVKIRPMMYLALSYDHRIVDGREAVQFLVHVKQMLEDPGWLLVEG